LKAWTCPNCGSTPDTPYCGRCGQSRALGLDLPSLFRGSFARILDLEGGFLHTFVRLTRDPGSVCRDYVVGRRQPYTHPVSYCFLLVTMYALTINMLGIEISFGDAIEYGETERRVYHTLHGILAYLLFLTLIPVAALQRRLFSASGYGLADSYVFTLFVLGHATIIGIVFAAAGWLATQAGIVAYFVLQFGYVLWAMTRFYGLRRPPALRCLLLAVVNFSITNVVSLAVGNLIVWLGLLEPLESLVA
jgi:hypothetical protein